MLLVAGWDTLGKPQMSLPLIYFVFTPYNKEAGSLQRLMKKEKYFHPGTTKLIKNF